MGAQHLLRFGSEFCADRLGGEDFHLGPPAEEPLQNLFLVISLKCHEKTFRGGAVGGQEEGS